MTPEQMVALVKRLERDAARHPRGYRLRVTALAALGYAYVGGALLAALGLLALLGAGYVAGGMKASFGFLKVGWLLLAFVYAVARSLWVRLPPPEGLRVDRARFPRLFAEIDDVRRRVEAPAPHEVLLTDELNCAVVQHPRLGVLGWHKNFLILGLPYLMAMSREEARAVIAHEFGHLAGAHGRMGAWVYRARTSWSQLLERMESDGHWGAHLFRPFFRRFAPYFNAYSFVLARAQEYEADRASTRAADARTAADALVRTHLTDGPYQSHWHRVWAGADAAATPSARPFSELAPASFAFAEPAQAERSLEAALAVETGYDDTHPSLRERLGALEQAPRVQPPPERSAAEELLGPGLAQLARELDERWARAAAPHWQERFEHASRERAELAALEAKRRAAPLTGDDRYRCAELVEALRDPEEALALQREILAEEPDHVSANLAFGRLLLARGDETGLAHLEAAIARSHTAILPSWRTAVQFLRRAGRDEEATRWLDRAREHEARLDAAEKERDVIPFEGQYVSHGLGPEALGALRDSVAKHADVKHAWLVRRKLLHFDDERPQWVLCVARRPGWLEWGRRRRERDLALQQRLTQIESEGDVRILAMNHRPRRTRKIFEAVPGAEIYRA